jgi:hypothetical protein
MIENEALAKQVSDLMLDVGARLDASLIQMQSVLPESEFNWYRDAGSRILTPMLLDVMNPLYARHPALMPPELS